MGYLIGISALVFGVVCVIAGVEGSATGFFATLTGTGSKINASTSSSASSGTGTASSGGSSTGSSTAGSGVGTPSLSARGGLI